MAERRFQRRPSLLLFEGLELASVFVSTVELFKLVIAVDGTVVK